MTDTNENETFDIGQIKKFIRLTMAKRKMEAKIEDINIRLEKMSKSLINHMIEHEVDRVPIKGGTTVYINTQIWGKRLDGYDPYDVVVAAREDGLHELVGQEQVHSQKLAGYLRELDRNEEKLPKNLARVIKPNPVSKLVVKKH
jgi:hypothetical protein